MMLRSCADIVILILRNTCNSVYSRKPIFGEKIATKVESREVMRSVVMYPRFYRVRVLSFNYPIKTGTALITRGNATATILRSQMQCTLLRLQIKDLLASVREGGVSKLKQCGHHGRSLGTSRQPLASSHRFGTGRSRILQDIRRRNNERFV